MTDDDYMAQMAARRKRRVRIALRIAGVAAVVAFVVWGPGLMIERAHHSAIACSNADYEDAPNPKTDCTGGKAWLLFPKIVPWKRAAALHEADSIDIDSAERHLKLASTFAPDADEQARAIADLGRLRRDVPASLGSGTYSAILSREGVAWRMDAQHGGLDAAGPQNRYLSQTLQRGAIDDAIAFVRAPPALAEEDYEARDTFLRRGALLCLAGEEALGRAALHDAIRVHAKFHSFVFIEARVGLAACGEVTKPTEDDLDRDALATFRLLEGLSGSDLEHAIAGDMYAGPIVHLGNASVLVAAAIAERERPLDATLRIVAGAKSPLTDALGPWPWALPTEGTPFFVDPTRDEQAAERLEAMAKTAPAKAKPLDSDAELALRMDYAIRDRYVAAVQAPQSALRNAARGFWIEASGARSRMGQCDVAETDGRRALALAPSSEERLYVASGLLRCGHFEAAGEVAHDEDGTPLLRALLLGVIRVQALAHAGKFDLALALAKELELRAKPVARPSDDVARLLSDAVPVMDAIDWLVLALSLHEGNAAAAPTIETPSIFEREKTNWRDLIAKPEAERAVLRWRMTNLDLGLWSGDRPAVLYVVGRATDAGTEVWLDEVAQPYTLAGGLPYMRARAEAARWRGDTKSATEWLTRVAATEKRITDPKKLALAKILGL